MIAALGGVDPRDLSSLVALSLTGIAEAVRPDLTRVAAGRSLSTIGFDSFEPSLPREMLALTYNRMGRLEEPLPDVRPLRDINLDALGHRRFEATYSPEQIARAYGFDRSERTGRGQTIAIPTAYHSPDLRSDLEVFNRRFGLPPIKLEIVNQSGGAPGGPTDVGWAIETALDVQWAHAVAPDAKILVVEAQSSRLLDLAQAVETARQRPEVSVVSMSWGTSEFPEELRFDTLFTTPRGHRGLTFVAASGDYGAGTLWPSVSPNVLSVGGTSLAVTSTGRYAGEIGWRGSGGGLSTFELEPAYQRSVQNTGRRSNPDVSYNGAPETGFAVYRGDWQTVGGTSAGAPQWAGLIALANEERAANGLGTLNQTQALVYRLPTEDFHDVVVGSNGYSAGFGYDLVTGRGSPYADRIIEDLARPLTPDLPRTFGFQAYTVASLLYPSKR